MVPLGTDADGWTMRKAGRKLEEVLAEIQVDEYRSEKVIERERINAAPAVGRPIRDERGRRRVALSNESINKTLVLLANILDTAVEHGLLASNRRKASDVV